MKASPDILRIVGADANNLREIDAIFPMHAITAVVGVSGSGKSSLVEETLAAEAARRMRHYLDVSIPGFTGDQRAYVSALPPLLFGGQRAFRASSRTTLATATGMLRVLRRLFLRIAEPFADDVNAPVPPASPEAFAAWLKAHASGRATVWATPVLHQPTTGAAAVQKLKAAGIEKVTVRSETDHGATAEKGRQVVLSRFKPLRSDVRHTIEVQLAHINIDKVPQGELQSLLERAWQLAPGNATVELHDMKEPALKLAYTYGLSSRAHRVHPKSPHVYAPPTAHLLSFNAPEHTESGACPACRGIGVGTALNEQALVVHPERSMNEGALALWTAKNYRYINIQHATIAGLKGRDGFDPDLPWRKLKREAQALILEGSSELVEDRDPKTGKKASAPHSFPGFRRAILEKAGRSTPAGLALANYVFQGPCQECGGSRWSQRARALRASTWSIDRLLSMPLSQLARETGPGSLARKSPPEAKNLVASLHRIAVSLENVGLGHLSGDRGMLDISDGESRRVRIGGVLSSRLAGLLLVLDEPARGLHEKDLDALGDAILEAAASHTVVMSEHRQRLVRRAHQVIEVGPGAGAAGGSVQYIGPVKGTSWARAARIEPNPSELDRSVKWLTLAGVHVHNVEGVTVKLPLGKLSCIAGVSGSGKSSFVRGALVPALAVILPKEQLEIDDFRVREGKWGKLTGEKHITSLHALDQSSGTAQRRSLVATFTGVAEPLRQAFGGQRDAKRLGLTPKDFGTNAGRGRCQKCLGLGVLDGSACPTCGGLRFGADVLSVRVDGWNLADLLSKPLQDLLDADLPKFFRFPVCESIVELGIGHLSLGRSLDTLSGGEVQRLRIARALSQPDGGGALFVLDEPAGGLHPDDVDKLERALRHMLADGKNTVVLVEHDPHLLAACDYIVEFGPGGGPEGGRVVASATPAEITKNKKSPTGQALASAPPKAKNTLRKSAPPARATTLAAAQRVRAEIRQIAGDDVEVPDDDDRILAPAAIINDTDGHRPHEIAKLDLQIGAFLLDTQPHQGSASLESLRLLWSDDPKLKLQIHPLLEAIAVWGPRVPRSIVEEANTHLAAMGLGPSLAAGANPLLARVSGTRFEPRDASDAARMQALQDAWALGGGYVELVGNGGKVCAIAQDRPMDLASGIVGPRHLTPAHLSRWDPRGACTTCKGLGALTSPDPKLVIARQSGKVLDKGALRPEAAAILKGVLRSDMMPFFQRLAKEGLWSASATWASLDKKDLAVLMHGFWVRPGLGTFLKSKKHDGSEVNHWLRWDGLVAALDSQLGRSKDSSWSEALRASKKPMKCPSCMGTGLDAAAKLVELDGRSYFDWVKGGSLRDLLKATAKVAAVSPRAAETRTRIISCLKSLKSSNPQLMDAVLGKSARPVWSAAAGEFTGMPLVDE